MKNVMKLLIIAFLTVVFTIITVLIVQPKFIERITMSNKREEASNTQYIDYEMIDFQTEGTANVLFKINNNLNNIENIKMPNGNIINLNNKNLIAIDYNIKNAQTYNFQIKLKSREIIQYPFNYTDNDAPEITIKLLATEYIEQAQVEADVKIIDKKCEINFSKCKWTINQISTKIGTDLSLYSNSILEGESRIKTQRIMEMGEYYIHVLAEDNWGNKQEIVSEKISVVKEKLYLFKDGLVNGFNWILMGPEDGDYSDIRDNSIYFVGTNATWCGAQWKLSEIDLNEYTKIYMELSTGKYYGSGGVNIRVNRYNGEKIIQTEESNLNHEIISSNLGEYAKDNITLYLTFSRWNPGCYVHKIWVE